MNFEGPLMETRNQLLNEISSLSFNELNRKPEENKWSIAQVCHHLSMVETLFSNAILIGLGEKGLKKTVPKNIEIVSNRSLKIEAPEISIPSSEPFELEQIIHLFSNSRNKFLEVLNAIEDKSILAERSVKHPVFGELPLNQWIEVLYLHEHRHIEQIKEIRKLVTF